MIPADPSAFAAGWAAAWNAHDADAVLAHFADDAIFTSPYAAQLLPETQGRLAGKAAIRDYWNQGLARLSDLHFTVTGVFAGIDTLVIAYTNQRGGRVSEVLRFENGLVVEGHGTYAPAD